MKTDLKIEQDVLAQLARQSNSDETHIGVIVKDGTVSLSGIVSDYPKKGIIERAVKLIAGVRAIAEEIHVNYGDSNKYLDEEIAKAAVNTLQWNASIPSEHIIVTVEAGNIYLTGELEWAFQKDFAKEPLNIYMVYEK